MQVFWFKLFQSCFCSLVSSFQDKNIKLVCDPSEQLGTFYYVVILFRAFKVLFVLICPVSRNRIYIEPIGEYFVIKVLNSFSSFFDPFCAVYLHLLMKCLLWVLSYELCVRSATLQYNILPNFSSILSVKHNWVCYHVRETRHYQLNLLSRVFMEAIFRGQKVETNRPHSVA